MEIRICIGSNDGATVAKSHMGDTAYFVIYDLGTDGNRLVEKRTNTAREMDHANADKMKAVIALVDDADVLVARQKSPNFVNIARTTRYQPVIVREESIADVLSVLQRSFQEIDAYVTRRRNGECFETIPELE